MSWLFVSIVAYFLVALQVILDKFLLSSGKVSHPAIYAFYSGVMSLFVLAFIPFGFHFFSLSEMILSFVSGMIFIYGMLMMFFAMTKSEASRVTPVVGAVIPVVTYFFSILLLVEDQLSFAQVFGAAMLIIGGLLISFDLNPARDKRFFAGFFSSIMAGILLAVSLALFKDLYVRDSFLNVFIWTRLGLAIGALSLLLSPDWRQAIFSSLQKFKQPEKHHQRAGILFIVNKAIGGVGSFLTNYAISLGSVTLVNALVSVEYVFVLLLGMLFSHWIPEVFNEKKDSKEFSQKMVSIAIITAGIILISN